MIHCGFVGLLGLPNAGKSSYLNWVLQETIAIVTDKPQTTRQAMSGILTEEDHFQLIFFDSPGFVEPKQGLFRFLASEFDRVIEKSDHLIMMVSHEQKECSVFKKSLERVAKSQKPVSYFFTKTDLPATPFIESLKKQFIDQGYPVVEFCLNHKYEQDHKDFLTQLAQTLPQEDHPLYDPDMISLDKTRDIVADFIREACFLNLQKEIPYGLGVIIKSFKREKGMRHIQANILVDKDNHKAIVIGQKGSNLKSIGQLARKKIEELLGEKIFLGLYVTHKKNWQKNQNIMKEVGYLND